MYFYLVVGIKSHLKSMMFWQFPQWVLFVQTRRVQLSPQLFFSQPLPPLFPCSPTFMWCFEGISFLVFTPHILGGNEPIFGQHLNTFQCWNSPPSLGFLFKAPEVFTKTRGALNPHCRWRRLCVWGAELSDWADWGRLDSFKRRAKGGISLLEF